MPEILIADKPTLDTVNTKVGTNNDAAGTTTIFSRVKQIYDFLAGNMSSTRMAKIDTIDNKLGAYSPTATTVLKDFEATRNKIQCYGGTKITELNTLPNLNGSQTPITVFKLEGKAFEIDHIYGSIGGTASSMVQWIAYLDGVIFLERSLTTSTNYKTGILFTSVEGLSVNTDPTLYTGSGLTNPSPLYANNSFEIRAWWASDAATTIRSLKVRYREGL